PRGYPRPRARRRLRRAGALPCLLPRHASDRDRGSGAGAPALRSRRPGLPRDGPEPLRRDRGPPRPARVPLARHRAPPPLPHPPALVGETPAASGKSSGRATERVQVAGRTPELLGDREETVVLCGPLRAAGRTRLDLTG